MLMATVFLTGSLLSGRRARRQHGHEHGHAHEHAHEHRHGNEVRQEGHLYENRETSDVPPPAIPPAGPGRQG